MEVHRCKFFEWMPSAVCAMAYHPELPMLVIGRENGNIEFWNTEEKWFCESVVYFLVVLRCRLFLDMRIYRFVP